MNPYVTNPDDVPPFDLYADQPLYCRYHPQPDDFHINRQHTNSQSIESSNYWASVVDICNESVRIYPAEEGGRDVFALGSVIIKWSHLHTQESAKYTETDYSYADANEVRAIAIAK